jgi:hypothetical protein
MGLADFGMAREELSWYFACADAAVGFRAQNYDPSSTGGVMDEDRIEALAQSMFSWQRRQALRRRADIEAARERVSTIDWSVLALVFTPVSEHLLGGPVVNVAVKREFMREKFPLFMAAVHSPTTLREFARAHEMAEDDAIILAKESTHRIREWLHTQANTPGERLSRILTGVENFVLPAVLAYDGAAREIVAEVEAAKDARTSQTNIKLGLAPR